MDRGDLAEIERFVELGSTLNGKYRIERVLGVGGMGAVVAAEHLKLGESVAIKFLLPRALGHGRQVQRFIREARSASKIRSSHVARVFDVDVRADGVPFIVMEHLVGETLGARLKREGPLEVERTVDDLLEACEAIAEAHSLGIVHRDLKPANLFLAQGAGNIGLLKVLDFGISKLVGPDSNETESTTGEGFIGSPPYMSPEQLTDPVRVDLRTDIWSIGVIFYECLTGRAPFKADGVGQVLALILQGRPVAVPKLRPEVPPGLVQIIERCMTKERDARYPNVLSLARDLSSHGTERGRRALTVIEAVSSGPSGSARASLSSDPSPTPSGPGLDTGTLSAAAEGPRPSSRSTLRGSRSRAALPVIAIAAVAAGIAFVQTRRVPEPSLPTSVASDGAATAPANTLVPAAPIVSAEVPFPTPSVAPPPSSRVKSPKARPVSVGSARSPTERRFDPVFDERR